MPDPVHDHAQPGGFSHAKGLHADDGHVKLRDHEDDKDVGEKEARDRYQEIGQERGGAIEDAAPENSRPDPDREGEGPCDNRADDEEGEAVQKPFIDLLKHRLVVLPGNGPAGKEVPVKIEVLDVKRFIKMEFRSDNLQD